MMTLSANTLRQTLAVLGCAALVVSCGESTPLIKSFTATPSSVDAGGTATLAWSVENADSITVADGAGKTLVDGSKNLMGSVSTGALAATTQFTLTAASGDTTVTRSLTVTVGGGGATPIISVFEVTPSMISQGGTATLRWMTTNATSVELKAGSVVLAANGPANGSQMVMPSSTTIYTLTAKGEGNRSTSQMVTLTVAPPAGTPRVKSFTATPSTIDRGNSTTLAWDVENAATITIRDPRNNVVTTGMRAMGSATAMPQDTTLYTLTADNGQGMTATSTVMVTVNVPMLPVIRTFNASPALIRLGQRSTLAWDVTATDSIEIRDGAGALVTMGRGGVGQFEVAPTNTTNYTLTARNADGMNTAMTTVTVERLVPLISDFTARPNPVAFGATTRIEWFAVGAASFNLLSGTNVLVNMSPSTDGRGTYTATITARSTQFTLQAMNVIGTSSRSLSVVGVPPPSIDEFTVTPLTFIGTVTATATWRTTDAATVSLERNGVPAVGFVSTASGTYTSSVSANTTFTLTATNLAGSVSRDVFVASLFQKLEPNNSSTTAIMLAGDGGGVAGRIDPSGDRDWFAVDVPAGGWVRAMTSNGRGGCDFDTVLTLTSSTALRTLVEDDDGGVRPCSLIEPRVRAQAANLPAGRYFLRVRGFSGTGQYVLQVWAGPPACGNAIRETGELCEDGNTIDGDGCSATCMIEPQGRILGPGLSSSFRGAIRPASNVDFYEVEMRAEGYIRAETFAPTRGVCDRDTRLRLWSSNFTMELGTDDSDGIGSCSLIDPQFDAWARVPAGTYHVSVEEDGQDSEIPAYVVDIRTIGIGCGNGILEPFTQPRAETCDDGNVNNGDGCSSLCQFEGVPEPMGDNNAYDAPDVLVIGAMQAVTPPAIVQGALDPAGDNDWYAIDVPMGYHLDARLTVGSLTNCPETPEGRLRLYGTNGTTELANDAISGPDGNCGAINPRVDVDSFNMPAGRYFLRVSESSGRAMPLYYLHVDVKAPGCGNGFVEAMESCDDGNLANNDGCSAMCRFEAINTFMAPGAPAVFTDAISPLGDVDAVQIVVTSTAYIRAETFTDAAARECVGGVDTFVRLYAADGLTLLGSDDFDGVSNCSLILPGVDAFARLVPGTYWISVREDGDNATIAAYELELSSLPVDICGNGVIETREFCDDGNTASGDGCSATCEFEPVATFVATPGSTSTIAGSLGVGVVDAIEIVATVPVHLRAEIFSSAAMRLCSDDTIIRLFNSSAEQVAFDDDDGVNFCSLLQRSTDPGVFLAPGRYFLTVEEFGRNSAINAYDLVLTATPGEICGDGLRDGAEQCDDRNMTAGDGCSAMCRFEILQVINLPADAPLTVSGQIPAANTIRTFQLDVSSPVLLSAESFAPTRMAGCTGGADTQIGIVDMNNRVLVADDDNGIGDCSRLDFSGATRLAAGTYYLVVVGISAVPAFELSIAVAMPDICGNGVLEPMLGEVCDDSNMMDGDGCSATCVFDTFTGPRPTNRIVGAISPRTEIDVIDLVVTATAWIVPRVWAPNVGECIWPNDPIMRLLDSTGTQLGADDSFGNVCAEFTTSDPWARVGPGRYQITIEQDAATEDIPRYVMDLSIIAADVCGNGLIERGEGCDDGNRNDGDGCSSMCAFENPPLAEVEPNGSFATATPLGIPGIGTRTATGALTPANDRDYWGFEVPANYRVRFNALTYTNGDPTSCSDMLDTIITLRNEGGTTIASNDDSNGLCSRLRNVRLGAGRYALEVRHWSASATHPRYFLDVEIVADVLNEVEPNDDAMTATPSGLTTTATLTITGAALGNADWFSFTVPAGGLRALRAVTYTGLFARATCAGDTLLTVTDATGATVLAVDDDSGPGLCSDLTVELMPGDYRLQLRSFGNVPTYYIDVALTLAPPRTPEREPNDLVMQATTATITAGRNLLQGELIAGDVDHFRFTVPPGAMWTVQIDTHSTSLRTNYCGGIDTVLTLLDGNGTLLADNDDGPNPTCSRVTEMLGPGTYHIAVEAYDAADEFPYFVTVMVR